MKSLLLWLFPRACVSSWRREYLPELARARAAREKSLQETKEDSMTRFMKDFTLDRARNPRAAADDGWDSEEGAEDDDDLDVNIIDQSMYLALCKPRGS